MVWINGQKNKPIWVQIGTDVDTVMYLQIDHIVSIQQTGKSRCLVTMIDGHEHVVLCDAKEVIEFISNRFD